MQRAIGHASTTPYQVDQSSFARLCQASLYVGRALKCASSFSAATAAAPPPPASSARVAELTALADELGGFCSAVDGGERGGAQPALALLAPRCVARSALFVLLDGFFCPERIAPEAGYVVVAAGAKGGEELRLQAYAMRVVRRACDEIRAIAGEVVSEGGGGADAGHGHEAAPAARLGRVSPFVVDALYCAAATFHWLLGESGTAVYRTGAEELGASMRALAARWRLAEKFGEIALLHDVSVKIAGSRAF